MEAACCRQLREPSAKAALSVPALHWWQQDGFGDVESPSQHSQYQTIAPTDLAQSEGNETAIA